MLSCQLSVSSSTSCIDRNPPSELLSDMCRLCGSLSAVHVHRERSWRYCLCRFARRGPEVTVCDEQVKTWLPYGRVSCGRSWQPVFPPLCSYVDRCHVWPYWTLRCNLWRWMVKGVRMRGPIWMGFQCRKACHQLPVTAWRSVYYTSASYKDIRMQYNGWRRLWLLHY